MTLLRAMLGLMGVLTCAVSPVCAAPPRAPNVTDQTRFEAMIADTKSAMLVDPQQAIARAAAAATLASRLDLAHRDAALATTQWLQGEAYLRLNEPQRAGPLIERALAAAGHKRPPVKLQGDILLSRGGYHTAVADVARALDDYQRAHNIFRDIGETRSRAIALLSIAMLYQEAKDYPNALKYYSQAVSVYRGDPQLLLTIYNNRGSALKEVGRYAEAEAQFNEALALARGMKSPILVARVLSNIARSQVLSGDLAGADRNIAEGLAVARGKDAAAAGAQFWSIAAMAAVKRGHFEQARTLIERGFAASDPNDKSIAGREGHEAAYTIYRKLGDEGRALQHLEALKTFDDRTSTLAASANTALAAARFDFANQELKIATLQRDEAKRTIAFERARTRTQQSVFAGVALATLVIFALLGFGLVTIRRSRNDVRAANIDLAHTNSALTKALAAKTEFLATTSHEIRTPLNGILGMTQVMLADTRIDGTTRDRVGVVHGAGVTMKALVDDILDVAKMETGNLTIESVAFDLRATLVDLTRIWTEQAQAKGVVFSIDLETCPGQIVGDPARLRQIVFNLLSNALKFTEVGSVALTAVAEGSDEDARLVITVTDTGIGIAADKHEAIFESFRQADGGTTRRYGGTGLGLAICRNLSRAMQGDVTVESAVDQGATFTLTLPLVHAASPEDAATETDPNGGEALLILDRNPISRAMLRTVLEPRVGTIVLAASVDEAASVLAGGRIGLLLVDDATLKACGDVRPVIARFVACARTVQARTALLWAGLDDESRAAFTAEGIDIVLAKPIAGPTLAAALYPTEHNVMDEGNALVSHAA